MTIRDLEKELIANGGNLSGIYKITRKSDGKVYIGQSECIVKRILQHINNIRETNSDKIDGAIQSEGWENFTYEVELALPELNTEQLWLAESTYIARYDSHNNGFNKTKGNHIGKYDHDTFVRKYIVSAGVTKTLRDRFKLDFSNKRVLLINLFDDQFVQVLKYRGCEVIQISKYFEERADLGNYIIEELKKYMEAKFDLIIANPPYGKIGANITKTVIDNIEFDEYINLLPANDYIRNDSKDLFRFVDLDSMTAINNGFSDAIVTTHAARITTRPRRYLSWEEFQIENYIDPSLTKYFYELRDREHSAIDNPTYKPKMKDFDKLFDLAKCIYFGKRDVNHGHLPYSKDCLSYKINVEHSITYAELINSSAKSEQALGNVGDFTLVQFDTVQEQTNITNFMYSENGFKFMSKVFTAMNVDSYCSTARFLPKVDWTRSWTVEEILADYGYTQTEINEVMADLVNFKGMED